MSIWTREPRDNEELCEWANHECGEWGSYILHGLSESKYSSLTFEWYYFLQHGLFACLSNRREEHEYKKTQSHEPYRWNGGEYYTGCPHDEVHEQEGFDRIFTETIFRDEHATCDESGTCDGEDNSPDLDWDQRESICIHEWHKHSSDEIVEHRKKYHGKESRYTSYNPYGSTDIYILISWFVALEVFLAGKCEHEEMDNDEECDHEYDTHCPGHAELPDDNTREYRYNGKSQPIHCSDLPIGPVSFSLGDEYGHKSQEYYHADIAHENPEHRHKDKNPEPGIPHITPSWLREY